MYYNFLTDLSFRQEPVDLDHWIEGYALQRYGRVSLPAQEALGKLLASVYAEETNRKRGPKAGFGTGFHPFCLQFSIVIIGFSWIFLGFSMAFH